MLEFFFPSNNTGFRFDVGQTATLMRHLSHIILAQSPQEPEHGDFQ